MISLVPRSARARGRQPVRGRAACSITVGRSPATRAQAMRVSRFVCWAGWSNFVSLMTAPSSSGLLPPSSPICSMPSRSAISTTRRDLARPERGASHQTPAVPSGEGKRRSGKSDSPTSHSREAKGELSCCPRLVQARAAAEDRSCMPASGIHRWPALGRRRKSAGSTSHFRGRGCLGRVRSRSFSAQQYVSMKSRTRPSSAVNSYAS